MDRKSMLTVLNRPLWQASLIYAGLILTAHTTVTLLSFTWLHGSLFLPVKSMSTNSFLRFLDQVSRLNLSKNITYETFTQIFMYIYSYTTNDILPLPSRKITLLFSKSWNTLLIFVPHHSVSNPNLFNHIPVRLR